MLDQGGVAVLLKLVQELDFVHRGQPERSTGRFADYIEHALPMAFEVGVDRHDVDREQPRRLFHQHATFNRRHDPFPQHDVVSARTHDFHTLIITNALNSGRKGGFVLPERGGVLKGRSVAVLQCKDGQINPVGRRVVPGDLFTCRLHGFQVFHGVRARVGPFLVSQQTGAWCRRGR